MKKEDFLRFVEIDEIPKDYKRHLIIYHKEDNDGVFSAAIINNYIKSDGTKTIVDFLPGTYSYLSHCAKEEDIVNYIKDNYDIVWMTDISFNEIDVMEELKKYFGSRFIWIDHHKAVIDKVKEQNLPINGIQSEEFSAIYNAFKFCYHKEFEELPLLLKYLTSYDSFNFTYLNQQNCVEVNLGINEMFDLNIKSVADFLGSIYDCCTGYQIGRNRSNEKSILDRAQEIGIDINNHNKRMWKNLCQTCAVNVDVAGRKGAMLLLSGPTTSHIFLSMFERGYQNGVCLKMTDKGDYILSLYNISNDDHEFHCGKYLQSKYNGGGHEGAAGATLSFEQFENILKTRKI